MSQEKAESIEIIQKIQFLHQELEKKIKADDKVRLCLDFMKNALSQKHDADFKAFWEAKAKCLDVFKEDLSPYIRERMWNEYLEINQQEKSLRAHLEKEASFAKEQILLAIDALQNDSMNIHLQIAKAESVELPKVDGQNSLLEDSQKELNVLGVLTEKIQSLRKEVIGTQIRYRDKNLFLKNLSEISDRVYPRRKALIQEISEAFESDVVNYCTTIFPVAIKSKRLYEVKEVIKGYQSLAKALTLNVSVFSKTRMRLSELWDKVKNLDQDRRKLTDDKKEIYSKNFSLVQLRLDDLIKRNLEENLEEKALLKEVETLFSYMRDLELAHKDIKVLRRKLEEIQEEVLGRDAREKQLQDKNAIEKIMTLKNEAMALIREEMDQKSLEERKNLLIEKKSSVTLSNSDEELINDLLATANAYPLSVEGDLDQQLERHLDFKKQVKGRIERYRKLLGGSAQDFERAFIYQELLGKEKNLFSELEKSIEKMEDKALDS